MAGQSVRVHRVLRAPPDRVYRAFLDPDAMAKWLPPDGFTGRVHHLEPKVGGSFRMSFTNFTTGQSHSFGGEYLELVPNERIRYTDKFDDPGLPGVMHATASLRAVSCGTELSIEQDGIPEAIPLGVLSRLAGLAHVASETGRSRNPRVVRPARRRCFPAARGGHSRDRGSVASGDSGVAAGGRASTNERQATLPKLLSLAIGGDFSPARRQPCASGPPGNSW